MSKIIVIITISGLGPMPWTVNSEIYPMWARSTGNSLATATNWVFNLIVSLTFLTLLEHVGKYGKYLISCTHSSFQVIYGPAHKILLLSHMRKCL